jgi:hypothetical protein
VQGQLEKIVISRFIERSNRRHPTWSRNDPKVCGSKADHFSMRDWPHGLSALSSRRASARLVSSIVDSATALIENKVADSPQPYETIT